MSSVVTTGTGSTHAQRATSAACSRRRATSPRFERLELSGDVTVAYDVAPDVLAYATYAHSFKSGGINLSGLPLDAANNPILAAATVKPEKVNHFEVGLKTQFLDRRATLNLAAFWTDINDYQATVTNGQLGVLRGYLANAEQGADAGVEVDFAVRPTSRFNVYANGAYTDAKYVKLRRRAVPARAVRRHRLPRPASPPSAPGTPGGISPANCDISGQRLPGVSKWAFSYGAEYGDPGAVARPGWPGLPRLRRQLSLAPSRPTRRRRPTPRSRAMRSATSASASGGGTAGTSSAGCATRSTRIISTCWRCNRAAPG